MSERATFYDDMGATAMEAIEKVIDEQKDERLSALWKEAKQGMDVVTHALEEKLLRRYDGIVTLKDGRVAETGTFDELMAKKGYFYALYTVAH